MTLKVSSTRALAAQSRARGGGGAVSLTPNNTTLITINCHRHQVLYHPCLNVDRRGKQQVVRVIHVHFLSENLSAAGEADPYCGGLHQEARGHAQ